MTEFSAHQGIERGLGIWNNFDQKWNHFVIADIVCVKLPSSEVALLTLVLYHMFVQGLQMLQNLLKTSSVVALC